MIRLVFFKCDILVFNQVCLQHIVLCCRH